MVILKAVILAAGVGSRLRPITADRPKPCVTVDEEPILGRQLETLAAAAVDEVYVVAGYLADQVRDLCAEVAAEWDGFTVEVIENERYDSTDNLYSLYLAQDAVDGEEFVLGNGDVVYDDQIARRVADADSGSVIACDPSTHSEEGMKVVVDGEGLVTHISKDVPRETAYATSIDLYRFSPGTSARLFEHVEGMVETEQERTCWTELAIDRVVRQGDHDVRPLDIDGNDWVEIDDHRDLLAADRTFSSLADLHSKAAVFFDLDGTLYLDDELVEGAGELVAELRDHETDVYFLTNNSSQWKTDYAEKLTDLGIPATAEDVVVSTDGVIRYCQEEELTETYVVGTEAMREAIARSGIAATAENPEAVVVGFDTELTYEKVRRGTLEIRDGAEFLLAHPDLVCPTAEGFVPDCGAIGALVEAATDREPDHVFGKPDPEMVRHVMANAGLAPEDVAIVGDRLSTEIQLAENLGCDSVCVLTGDTDRRAVEDSDVWPSLVVPAVTTLRQFVRPSAPSS